ncbi:uncharacterized protein [Pleurodeles waltl]|uniref:uncharacterized protein isoform X1 n=1 Tax=Pleurodeles waltl TaxID=8319 RepID=UPI0037097F17
MTHERRKGLLLKLDPKLANLAPKDPGAKADGLLFGDNFIKELRPVEAEAAPPTALPETKASEDHLLTSNNSNKTFVPSSIPSTPEDTEGGANADPTTIQVNLPSGHPSVGGRLKLFLHKWIEITSDPWVLNTIKGYLIEFYEIPYQNFPLLPLKFSKEMSDLISAEIQELLQKQAIQPAFPLPSAFISSSSISRFQINNILRRYSSNASRHFYSEVPTRLHHLSSFRPRLSSKSAEVNFYPFTGDGILRIPDQFPSRSPSTPDLKNKTHQIRDNPIFTADFSLPQVSCKNCRSSFFFNSSNLSRSSSLSGSSEFKNSSSSQGSCLFRFHPPRSRIPYRTPMVAGSPRSLERQDHLCLSPRSCVRIRCKPNRLGRKVWSRIDWRHMVSTGVFIAHQLFRDACRILCNKDFHQKQSFLFRTSSYGQSYSGKIYKSPWRY